MKLINNLERTKSLYNIVVNEIKTFMPSRERKWSYSNTFNKNILEVYQINNGKSVWVSVAEQPIWDKDEINRVGILTALPITNEPNESLNQVLEINFPFNPSNQSNTLLYEEGIFTEVRIYGKFTKRTRLKSELFFDWLIKNGYEDEIKIDENKRKYICAFQFINNQIDKNHLANRLIEITYMVYKFKGDLPKKVPNVQVSDTTGDDQRIKSW